MGKKNIAILYVGAGALVANLVCLLLSFQVAMLRAEIADQGQEIADWHGFDHEVTTGSEYASFTDGRGQQ